jgi:hypothetical protein
MASWDNKYKFGSATSSTDNYLLCDTKHKVYAYYTDDKTAFKDFIILGFEAFDTSGIGTSYKQDMAGLHKVRFKVYNNGKKVYEEDIVGDSGGQAFSMPLLINEEGLWEVTATSIASGDCSKPSMNKKILGSFAARPPIQEEEEKEQTLDDEVSSPTKPEDNWLLYGVLGLFVIFGIKKIKK